MSIEGSHSGGNEKNRGPKRLPMGCSGSQRGLKERKRELIAGGGPGYWQNPFRWRRPGRRQKTLFAGGGPGYWQKPLSAGGGPSYWQKPLSAGGGPGYWQNPLFAGGGPSYWRKSFPLRSVRATGVGSTAQINAQACNSEKRCDSLQITFLLKDNYAKIKYQNIKDGHKTNEQLFYIRSAYHRTAA